MTIEPETHFLTSAEITEVESLGFQFLGISTLQEDFVNTHFPNCNLLLFLKQINIIFSPLCDVPVNKFIHPDNSITPKIEIQFYTDDYNDETQGLALSGIFLWQDGDLVL